MLNGEQHNASAYYIHIKQGLVIMVVGLWFIIKALFKSLKSESPKLNKFTTGFLILSITGQSATAPSVFTGETSSASCPP